MKDDGRVETSLSACIATEASAAETYASEPACLLAAPLPLLLTSIIWRVCLRAVSPQLTWQIPAHVCEIFYSLPMGPAVSC